MRVSLAQNIHLNVSTAAAGLPTSDRRLADEVTHSRTHKSKNNRTDDGVFDSYPKSLLSNKEITDSNDDEDDETHHATGSFRVLRWILVPLAELCSDRLA